MLLGGVNRLCAQPPEHAACKQDDSVGRCMQEKCVIGPIVADKPLSDYVAAAPVNGSYKETESPQAEECVILPEHLSRICEREVGRV